MPSRGALPLLLASLLADTALSKELMRSRCSACEAVATELQEWFYPTEDTTLQGQDPEYARAKRKEAEDKPPPPPIVWQPLPSGIGALKTVELLEGLCSKVEVYELMGRSTQDTETEVSPDMDKMTWQRADPDNMAHKVNVRIGLVRAPSLLPADPASVPSAAENRGRAGGLGARRDQGLLRRHAGAPLHLPGNPQRRPHSEIHAGAQERLEESLIDHIETGEAGAIENARSYLCEQETKECVGNAREHLVERHAEEVRAPALSSFPLTLWLVQKQMSVGGLGAGERAVGAAEGGGSGGQRPRPEGQGRRELGGHGAGLLRWLGGGGGLSALGNLQRAAGGRRGVQVPMRGTQTPSPFPQRCRGGLLTAFCRCASTRRAATTSTPAGSTRRPGACC